MKESEYYSATSVHGKTGLMTNVAPVLESRKGECLKNFPMSNDEKMKCPFDGIRSKANLSDFEHSPFFRH